MLREFGILMKLDGSTKFVSRDAEAADTQASIEDTAAILVISMIGVLASIFCLVAEIIIFWCRCYFRRQIFSPIIPFSD
jgi:hypothetical protein